MADEYRLTSRADADLEALFEYSVLNFGEARADKYVAGLIRRFEFLGENPFAGSEKGHVKPNAQLSVYGSHSIYYLVEDKGVLILRILGAGRDPLREL